MRIINLTPHAVTLVGDERTVTIPPSGTVARCAVERRQVGTVDVDDLTVPITTTVMGAVEGLPPAEDGTLYIVSRVVAEAARGRTDLVIPDDTVRDEAGRIVGCRALARVADDRAQLAARIARAAEQNGVDPFTARDIYRMVAGA